MFCDTKDALVKSNTTQRQVSFFLTMSSPSSKTRDEHMEFLDTLNTAPDILDLFIALNKYRIAGNVRMVQIFVYFECSLYIRN